MGLREVYGGMIEAAINAAIETNLSAELLKDQGYKLVDKLVDENIDKIKAALKAGVDKIDGEVG